MKPVTVLTFNEPEQTTPVKTRLQKAHIASTVHDERNIQQFFYLSEPLAGIHLRVDRRDYERTLQLLREWERAEGVLRDAIHCPECGSSRVEYPQFARKSNLPAVGALLCAMTGIIEREFFCEDCHSTWPVPVQAQPAVNTLGSPGTMPQVELHSKV